MPSIFSDPAFAFIRDLIPWIVAYIILSLSLNLEYGYLGLPNFGKLLSVSGGAFIAGFLPGLIAYYLLNLSSIGDFYDKNALVIFTINSILATNPALSIALLVITLIAAMAFGAFLGLISSYPALRLREDYLAMTLLAFGEVLVVIGYNSKYPVGGSLGVIVPSMLQWLSMFGLDSAEIQTIKALFFLALAFLVYLAIQRLLNSPLGRTLKAIRDNETLARSLGKDIVDYRMKVMVIAGALAGLAGAIVALNSEAVISNAYRRVTFTFYPWVMVVVGGAGNNLGVMVGAAIFMSIIKIVDQFKYEAEGFLPFDPVWLTYLALSLSLAAILLIRPRGIIEEKPTKTLTEEELRELLNKIKAK